VRTRFGSIRALPTAALADLASDPLKISRGSAEQSNTSIVYGSRLILKLFRRLEPGPNPDFEIGRYLTERARFDRVPPLAGGIEYHLPGVEPTTLAMLQGLVANQGNGWDRAVGEVRRYLERAASSTEPPALESHSAGSLLRLAGGPVPPSVVGLVDGSLENAATLGQRTAEMHLALAAEHTDPAFAPAPMTAAGFDALAAEMDTHAQEVLALLENNIDSLPRASAVKARAVLDATARLRALLASVATVEEPISRTRIHGDYHLGQVLWAENDFVILDFEGEPARPLAERREKQLPLKDVAGMLRSYSYAAYAALFAQTLDRPADFDRLEPWARLWETWNSAVFLQSYLTAAGEAPFVPKSRAVLESLLGAFLLDKALYELRYELNSRPGWLDVPLWGIPPLMA
jgi:maltose alpha-D-glucosyltransferase/alpha-amylase